MKRIRKPLFILTWLFLILCLLGGFFVGCSAARSSASTEMAESMPQSGPSGSAIEYYEEEATPLEYNTDHVFGMVQDYTVDLFEDAYSPYFQIDGFGFDFGELVWEGDGFTLTYTVNMTTTSENGTATTPFPLYLEASGMDVDLFSLYYISSDITSNKGLPYIPIMDVFPPVTKSHTISIPVSAEEFFGTIEISGDTLTLSQKVWQTDLSADNGYTVQDLETTATFPLSPDLQISYLNFGATAQITDLTTLVDYLNSTEHPDYEPLFWGYVEDGQVVVLIEQYRP